jgi:hypothetical protein
VSEYVNLLFNIHCLLLKPPRLRQAKLRGLGEN